MKKESFGIIEHQEKKMTLSEAIAQRNTYKENINVRDIYQMVGVPLIERDYYGSTLEEKAIMVEEELKIYIAHKLAYCGYFISDKEAVLTEISELLTKLYELTAKNKAIVYGLTHYILGLFTEIQGYQAIWQIEDEEAFITNPVLEERDGTLDRLKTHLNTEPITIFNLVFDYYLSKCTKKDLSRKRIKEELPENGE